MARAAKLVFSLFVFLAPAFSYSQIVTLTDGPGTLTWDTSISVGAVMDNTTLTHPSFPTIEHRREGWFAYLNSGPGFLHEFTNFVVTPTSGNHSSLTSTWSTPIGQPITLRLDYSLNGVGPQQFPNLSWNGVLERPIAGSSIPTLDVRLFNIFDYDLGFDPTVDLAEVTQTFGPNTTLVKITGDNANVGNRGAFNNTAYQVSELGPILSEIVTNQTLNNMIAPGSAASLDAAGGFEWHIPNLGIGPGNGFGGFGGFGGFSSEVVPEPSSTSILAMGTITFWGSRRRRR